MAGGRVPIELLLRANPVYLRTNLGDLRPLTKSIRRQGIINPIVADGSFLVFDGARRLEVARQLGERSVLAIVTDSWPTIQAELLRVGELNRTDPLVLPKSMPDYVSLLPQLVKLSWRWTQGNSRKISARRRKGEEIENDFGFYETMTRLFDISRNTGSQIVQVGALLAKQVEEGNKENVAAIVEIIGTPDISSTRMLRQVQRLLTPERFVQAPPPPPPVHGVLVRAQAKQLDRAFDMFRGIVDGLPSPSEISSEHEPETYNQWLKQMTLVTTAMHRMRARIRAIQQEERTDHGNEGSDPSAS